MRGIIGSKICTYVYYSTIRGIMALTFATKETWPNRESALGVVGLDYSDCFFSAILYAIFNIPKLSSVLLV